MDEGGEKEKESQNLARFLTWAGGHPAVRGHRVPPEEQTNTDPLKIVSIEVPAKVGEAATKHKKMDSGLATYDLWLLKQENAKPYPTPTTEAFVLIL